MNYRLEEYILGGKSCEYVSDVKMLRELVYIKHFLQIWYKTNLFFFFLLDERKKQHKKYIGLFH